MTKYAFNATVSISTRLFVFMTNYDFESRMSFDSIEIEKTIRKRVLKKKKIDISRKMKNIWKFIKEKLIVTQINQKNHANIKKIDAFDYQEENMIWLSIKNIKTKKSFKKLNWKMIDFYKIKKILNASCQLKLSSSMNTHDTFHIFLLKKISNDSISRQKQSSSSIVMNENEKEKYELNDILNSRRHRRQLQYRVQ